MVLICISLNLFFIRPSLLEIGPVFLEKKTLKFSPFIFQFSKLHVSPFGKRHGPWLKHIWVPFTKGYFLQSLVEIGPKVLQRNIFLIRQCIFLISYLLLLEMSVAFIWTNLNPIHEMMFMSIFVKICIEVLEKFFFIFVNFVVVAIS